MDLSIIIPCYNLENYIHKCLSSLIEQEFDDIDVEIIFVLDKCTDATEDIIIDYMVDWKGDWRIEEVNVRSAGFARNRGLEVAHGCYIWFIDGDDALTNTQAIDIVMKELRADSDLDFVFFRYISQGFKGKNANTLWRYVFKRSFIGNLRFVKQMPKEDNIFLDELLLQPCKRKNLQDVLYWYNYPREGSTMSYVAKTNNWDVDNWDEVE